MSKTNASQFDGLPVGLAAVSDVDPGAGAMGIAAVERDTGLSKDLLRVWERRYGFPQPLRDAQGERLYPQDQVLRLRHIKRLLDGGHRPSHVVALPPEALRQRLEALQESVARATPAPGSSVSDALLDQLLEPLLSHQLYALQEGLQTQMLKRGLAPYVVELLAPLVGRVGQLWSQGRLQIYEEHLFTEVVQQQLHRAIGMLPTQESKDRPRVLISTLPGEPHGLGLLMAKALLSLNGAHCVSLGTQTPVGDLLEALRTQEADVLALSFSAYASPALIEDGVGHLMAGLPPRNELWLGGAASGLRRVRDRWQQVRVIAHLSEVADAVNAWRDR